MKKRHSLLFIAAAILIGCSSKHNKSPHQVITLEASVDTVISLDMCIYPIQIEKVGDYLVILDLGNKTQCLSAYSLDGELIQRFGNAGHAANEVNEVSHFFKMDEHRISVNKPGGILYFDLDSFDGSNCQYEYKHIKTSPVSVHSIYADSLGVLCLSNSKEERFSYTNEEGSTFVYNSYPTEFIDQPNDQQAVFNYAPKFGVDMKKKRFCVGTYIGGILETFQISSSGIESLGKNELFRSKYKKFENGAVSWNEKSQIGFDAISIGDEHIYTLLSGAKGDCLLKGEQASFADKITVFNWDATLHSEIYVGHNMLSLCVSEERKEIYAICYKQGESFYLIHATW